MIRVSQPDEAFRAATCRRRPELRSATGCGHRFPRPQRRRQNDHDAPDTGAGKAGQRHGHDQRRPPTSSCVRPCGRWGPSWTPRRTTPGARPATTSWPWPRQGASRPERVEEVLDLVGLTRRRRPKGGHFLARHGPAPGDRGRAPRGPPDRDLRRTRQRPRPRGHRLGAHPHAVSGPSGPHRLRLQPPDERDGPHGITRDRDRQGPPHRRLHG